MGSASVILINGEKLVIANMGDYRTVVCRDGIAHQTTGTYRRLEKMHWSRRLFAGILYNTKDVYVIMRMSSHFGKGKNQC